MTTAIDTNVIVALWDEENSLHRQARGALDKAFGAGPLAICGAVYAELLAGPRRTTEFLDEFCAVTRIQVEWDLREPVWRAAGAAFQGHAGRRRRGKKAEARRILADFVIGAHALVSGYKLLTLDAGVYAASFPRLAIVEL